MTIPMGPLFQYDNDLSPLLQYDNIQYDTVQYDTIQYDTIPDSITVVYRQLIRLSK